MNDQNLKELEREQADNKLINDAFQHLIDTYVASRHRKKVDIVTKASTLHDKLTKEYDDSLVSHISCTLSPWLKSPAKKWD